MHAPIVPPFRNVQALVDAAVEMVVSGEGIGLISGPTEAGASELEEGNAPAGMPPLS